MNAMIHFIVVLTFKLKPIVITISMFRRNRRMFADCGDDGDGMGYNKNRRTTKIKKNQIDDGAPKVVVPEAQ